MKFCENCGKKIGLFEKHVCGEKENVETTKNNKKFKLSNKTIIAIVISAFVLVVVTVLLLLGSKAKAFDHVTVTYGGFNTQGTVKINFDKEALIESVIGEEPDSTNMESYVKWYDQYTYFEGEITMSVDKETGLSNGDKITVTIDPGRVGGRIKGGKKTFEVSGLKDAELVDVFKDIKFEITGFSGKSELKITNKSDDEFVKACTFSADKKHNLYNGDTVVITVNYNEEDAQEYNCIPSALTKTITVSDLPELVTNAADIDSSVIKSIADRFLSEKSKKAGDFLFTYKNYKFYKSYLLTKKFGAFVADDNQILVYIKYDRYYRGSFDETIYLPLVFKDVTISNGKLNIKYEDGSAPTFTTNIESSIEDFKEDYNVTEIN